MTDLIDCRTRSRALVAVVAGVLGLLAIEYREEPQTTAVDFLSRWSTSSPSFG